jgi:hypothetical protein
VAEGGERELGVLASLLFLLMMGKYARSLTSFPGLIVFCSRCAENTAWSRGKTKQILNKIIVERAAPRERGQKFGRGPDLTGSVRRSWTLLYRAGRCHHGRASVLPAGCCRGSNASKSKSASHMVWRRDATRYMGSCHACIGMVPAKVRVPVGNRAGSLIH